MIPSDSDQKNVGYHPRDPSSVTPCCLGKKQYSLLFRGNNNHALHIRITICESCNYDSEELLCFTDFTVLTISFPSFKSDYPSIVSASNHYQHPNRFQETLIPHNLDELSNS
jgi:hypothetical protein